MSTLIKTHIKDQLVNYGKEATIRNIRLNRHLVYRVIATAIKISHLPKEDREDGLKEATYIEIPKLEKHMDIV